MLSGAVIAAEAPSGTCVQEVSGRVIVRGRGRGGRSEQTHCAEQEWATRLTATRDRAPTRVETVKARQHFAHTTRPPKTVHALTDLLAEWTNRTRALTGVEPLDLAARPLRGDYGRPLHAHDVGPEVRAAIVAQMLQKISTKRSVWTT